ncbi:MAG: UDP-N-acetylmuramoyl-L-alanyl-D-glutamate--2,6-diaminopimelate ligase [bacterium]
MMLSELLGYELDDGKIDIVGLTPDSRQVKPGFLFAALEGENFDGAKFIPQAEKAGAVAILARNGVKTSLPLIASAEPRRELARLAAKFHPGQPNCIAGITGTNGKTSVARFSQQLWSLLGQKSASLGTLGAFADGYEYKLQHTTPHPVEIHQILSTMTAIGTSHLAMEISSHGLAQYRADGVGIRLAAFTNITRDHLDYHHNFEDYFSAKLRLFTDLLGQNGTAVINIDGAGSDKVIEVIQANGQQKIITVGHQGKDITLLSTDPRPFGLDMRVEAEGVQYDLSLPLIGAFQAENALTAAGLVLASGFKASDILPLLEKLEGAPGRMQHVADKVLPTGKAGVYVDYAHTPDALTTILQAARPHASGRIIVVFGAGGDRDTQKRPLMGAAARDGADIQIITDDNPREERASDIRAQIKTACPDALEIGERRKAILKGIELLEAGDVLVIAGKGHEAGQTIKGVTHPFNDRQVAQQLLRELGMGRTGS